MPNRRRTSHSQAGSDTHVRFPVITAVTVEDYALFPGVDGRGLSFTFQRGVSVIVGVNGIGKTTLLMMCYRALLGPRDWKKRDPGQGAGGGQVSLGQWRAPTFFRDRVPDAAVRATITMDVSIGGHTITIERALRDLSIRYFAVDDDVLDNDQATYESKVTELCGLGHFTDFALVLHYLLFFLEDRTPLLWDADAQRELLRALLFRPDDASRTRALFNTISALDSRHRNRRAHLAALQADLMRLMGTPGGVQPSEEVRNLQTQGSGVRKRLQRANRDIEAAIDQLERSRLALERARIELTERQEEFALAEAERLHGLVGIAPTNEGPAAFIGQAAAGAGCLVCGSQAAAVRERLLERLRAQACPFCAAPASEHEGSTLHRNSGHERSRKGHQARLDEALRRVEGQAQEVDEAQRRYAAAVHAATVARDELQSLEAHLESLGAKLPADSKEVEQLQRGIEATKPIVATLAGELGEAVGRYVKMQRANLERVSAVSNAIVERFHEYAEHFLAEDTALTYAIEDRRLGQSEHLAPTARFQPQMTTASQPRQRVARESRQAVSESQREFLDLAFRMALLRTVTPDSGVMLVLETPEASLDIVFTVRAGELLGQFANAGNNRVIATSNLTNGLMVPSLFGTARIPGVTSAKRPPHYRARLQREQRILDLLAVAAPNAAVRKYGTAYRRALTMALKREPK